MGLCEIGRGRSRGPLPQFENLWDRYLRQQREQRGGLLWLKVARVSSRSPRLGAPQPVIRASWKKSWSPALTIMAVLRLTEGPRKRSREYKTPRTSLVTYFPQAAPHFLKFPACFQKAPSHQGFGTFPIPTATLFLLQSIFAFSACADPRAQILTRG